MAIREATGRSVRVEPVYIPTAADGESDRPTYIGRATVGGIIGPTAWTSAAALTFLVSHKEDGTFVDLYDDSGAEVAVPMDADRGVAINTDALNFAPWLWLKVRSGTSGTPVQQAAVRKLYLILKG